VNLNKGVVDGIATFTGAIPMGVLGIGVNYVTGVICNGLIAGNEGIGFCEGGIDFNDIQMSNTRSVFLLVRKGIDS
jgi:hypothetical protein